MIPCGFLLVGVSCLHRHWFLCRSPGRLTVLVLPMSTPLLAGPPVYPTQFTEGQFCLPRNCRRICDLDKQSSSLPAGLNYIFPQQGLELQPQEEPLRSFSFSLGESPFQVAPSLDTLLLPLKEPEKIPSVLVTCLSECINFYIRFSLLSPLCGFYVLSESIGYNDMRDYNFKNSAPVDTWNIPLFETSSL